MVTLEKVNEWAKKSCPKWNKNKLSRRYYREKYRNAAKEWWQSSEGRKIIDIHHSHDFHGVNTYPWPYCAPDFANWEEDDSADGYNLISDQSGCVVKYATSYCAYKIFEATGTWPQKTSKERLDAKRWQQFLAEAGYTKIVGCPKDGHHYVGIKPDEGEWGLVVWFEHLGPEIHIVERLLYVSSYVNKEHKVWTVHPDDYTWVQID